MSGSSLSAVAPLLARLLEEPDEAWCATLDAARVQLERETPEAAELVCRWIADTAADSPDLLRERHVYTFDLAPTCVPYLSVHLFGEESFKRAGLMGGLADAYRQAGFEPAGELPDHLATVLRFLPQMTGEEQDDLVQFVLRPAVDRMTQALANSQNPYRHLLDAVHCVLVRSSRTEAVDA
ncbi:MAG: nitrate reductase molybdenum cofactor assembly chaperone [Acidobacteriota bacterium]